MHLGLLALALLAPCANAKDHFGAPRARLSGLSRPAAVAFDPVGRVLVADTGNHRVAVFDAGGARRALWGERGSEAGQLCRPAGIDVAPDGHVYVADTGNHRVQVFDLEGNALFHFGTRGRAEGQLCEPRGLAVDDQRVVVADSGNQRIQVFERDGRFVRSIGVAGDFDGAFLAPVDVALGQDGRMFVVDELRNRVVTLDSVGRVSSAFGERGPRYGLFSRPIGIDVHAGRVFVADQFNHRVQEFDRAGTFVASFPGPAFTPRSEDGKLFSPAGLAISPRADLIAVAEPLEDRVQLYGEAPPHDSAQLHADHTGIEDSLARVGDGAGAAGRLLAVVDPELRAVSVFDLTQTEPVLITRLGALGGAGLRLQAPADAAIELARGWVHVSDPVSARVLSFRLQRNAENPAQFDADMGRLVRVVDFDGLPDGPALDTLEWPVRPGALAARADGGLYVADERNGAIVELGPRGRPKRSWSRAGAQRLRRPVDLALSPDGLQLYVVDADLCSVLVFDPAGALQRTLGGYGEAKDGFLEPSGVFPLDEDRVFVTDRGANCVHLFDPTGPWLGAWGTSGTGPAQLNQPSAVVGVGAEFIFVIDPGNRRGQVLTPTGRFVLNF